MTLKRNPIALKNYSVRKPYDRSFSSQSFEQKTMLPFEEISTTTIKIDKRIQQYLHRHRIKFEEKVVTLNNGGTKQRFLTAKKESFEPLLVHNELVNHLPALPAGAKQPDEFYLNIPKKTAFIVEKKTQRHAEGSVDEKIQTGAFKRYVLSQKFKKG
jgi:hypothetical protein